MADFLDVNLSHFTRDQYLPRLKLFFDSLGLQGSLDKQSRLFLTKVKKKRGREWAQDGLKVYIRKKKQQAAAGELAESTIRNFYKPIKLFCSVHDVELSWTKITNIIPTGRKFANDRAPTHEEIQKLITYPDRRIKPLVLVTSSSGIRLGAWDYLRWKHIEPIKRDDKIIAAKILVYAGENEQYFSFITPEAFEALKEWMDYRKTSGEDITGESWLLRTPWDTTSMTKIKEIKSPKKMARDSIKHLLDRAIRSQGLRPTTRVRRYEWKMSHGFRKFFQTNAEPKMKSLDVMTLMGQDTGLAASYNKPTVEMLLNEYLKAVDNLTIDKTRQINEDVLKNQQMLVAKIQVKDKQMQTQENEISALKEQMAKMESREQEITTLKQRLSEMNTIAKEVDSMREQVAGLKRNSDEFKKLLDMTNLLQEAVDIAKIVDPSLASLPKSRAVVDDTENKNYLKQISKDMRKQAAK